VEAANDRLAVECDGISYHNSRDAVEYDKRRDRFFAVQGVFVMRFTGAEINRDPRGCAAQVGLWVRARL
jgi:very-short-patch-repair endonuclease